MKIFHFLVISNLKFVFVHFLLLVTFCLDKSEKKIKQRWQKYKNDFAQEKCLFAVFLILK